MAATVTLVYKATSTGSKTAAQLVTLMQVPAFDPAILEITGATVTSDSTVVAGAAAVRTIVLNTAAAVFQQMLAGSETSPFFGIMTAILRAACNQPIVEALPVAA